MFDYFNFDTKSFIINFLDSRLSYGTTRGFPMEIKGQELSQNIYVRG